MPDEYWPEKTEVGSDWETWDPVTLAEYLSSLESAEPAMDLVLEMRRHVLNADRISLDIRGRTALRRKGMPNR